MISLIQRHPTEATPRPQLRVPSGTPSGNDVSDRLGALPLVTRAFILGEIVDKDYCVGVDALYMGSSGDRQAFWSVRCQDGRSFQVTIEPDALGHTSIMNCAVLKAVADVDCFVRLSDQQDRPRRSRDQIKADIDRLPPEVRREALDSLRKNLRRAK